MKLYVAGPMTGLPNYNRAAFHVAARELRSYGYTVINPAELNPTDDKPWSWYLRRDLIAMLDCDGIYLLKGWEESKGANLEKLVAETLGMAVWYEQ